MAKVKVPKRVGGVKVPKKLRKQAKRALELVDSPAARDLALAGLAIAAESVIDRGRANKGNGKRLQDVLKDGLDGSSLAKCCAPPPSKAPGASSKDSRRDSGRRNRQPARPAKTAKPRAPPGRRGAPGLRAPPSRRGLQRPQAPPSRRGRPRPRAPPRPRGPPNGASVRKLQAPQSPPNLPAPQGSRARQA